MKFRISNLESQIPPGEELEAKIYAKVTWRLIPFLCLCFMIAFMDRVNVSFAKLQMLGDLKFSETVYGLGAGMFFIAYFLFEVPSNIIMHRVGARRWIARIMITWAIVTGLMAFVASAAGFYIMRFLLGVAEAGFFPGIILYLTYWYPARYRSKIIAMFMMAVPVSGVIGGIFSGWIMESFAGICGWNGWQWLFLGEGVPSLIIGVLVYFYLDDGIRRAAWLTEQEKQILEGHIEREARDKPAHSLRTAFTDSKVWRLSLVYFCSSMGNYGFAFWLPTIIHSTGVKSTLDIGLLSAIPYGVGALFMVWIGRHSDKHKERRWHWAISACLGGVGLILSAVFGGNTVIAMAALTLAAIGIYAQAPVFWSMPTAFLTGVAAAAGIAFINSLGNLAGFLSPYIVGWIKDTTQSTDIGMYVMACSLFLGALVVLSLPKGLEKR